MREYLDLLERKGELVRIGAFVDPVLEMAEIADRMAKSPGGGKALLFENTGTAFPVAMNIFGSARRMALALGVDSLDDIPRRIREVISMAMSPKGSVAEKMAVVPLLGEASRWFPKRSRRRGECQRVVFTGDDVRLGMLPVLKCWPADGGRFVTLPMVNTVDPDSGVPNVGMYRMQVFDDCTTGMHWHMHKTGARHYEAYRRAGRRMPVSVCLGGDPVYTYAATAPLPDGIDEYLLAGFLRGRPVKLVKCLTNDIYVPADCDFVIEGYVDPAEEKTVEGPFGDHTGFYSLEDLYPCFHVTAVTHRRDAVWPATIVGIPPQEDVYISQATEKIFLEPIRLAIQPEIADLYMPPAGVSHNLAVVSMTPRYPGHVDAAVSSLWGAGQMMFDKYMIVAPAGADVRDADMLAALLRGADPEKSAIRGSGALDVLDHASATPCYGGKLAFDLTGAQPVPELDTAIGELVAAGGITGWSMDFFRRWGVVALFADPAAAVDVAAFLGVNGLCPKCAVVFDETAAGLAGGELLWLATGNTDPARDAVFRGGTLIVDARTKLPGKPGNGNPARFPNPVTAAPETIRLVDERWAEYGIGEFLPSPSSRYRSLLRSQGAEVETDGVR